MPVVKMPFLQRITALSDKESLHKWLREGSLYFGLLAIFLVGYFISDTFRTLDNQRDVLRSVSTNGMLAVGMTLVILIAGIDLSVGRLLGLGSTLAAMLLMERQWTGATWVTLPAAALAGGGFVSWMALVIVKRKKARVRLSLPAGMAGFILGAGIILGWGIWQVPRGFGVVGVLIVVPLAGLVLGALSGVIIAKGRLQPFIVTLAMMISAYGGARLIAGGGGRIHPIYVGAGGAPATVGLLRARIFDLVPVPGIFFLTSVIIAYFILTKLRFGRYIYAIGGNEETAHFSGINVARIKIAVYSISGFLSCLAGVLAAAQYRQGKPDMGAGTELDAIAAVVIGGTSLMGGRGRITGTLVGVLIFGYLNNILSLKGVHADYQLLLKGIIIVGAVLLQEGQFNRWIHHLRKKAKA